ncbi:tetratricopeptide repeat protein [Pseudohalioglobus sediminis]|uniref:Tetratricopeptide repeat protein n=1 Tax=Pseudohalioglobus sediminis TaxID=2606449 RepID=A0A5B0WPZ9_9GAMM|nr:tetratricopeptide repeat protein [Pseudohalioglobus sediminis]
MPTPLLHAARHIAAGEFAKAEALLRPFVHDNPADVNGIRMLGEVGMALGALRDADRLLARAVELAPDYDAARYAWANALYKRHRYADALAQLDLLLAKEPDNAAWLTLKAANLVEINEHADALPIFERILQMHPDHRQAHLSYGHALRAVGRVEGCVTAYEKCIALDSGAGEAYWSLANLKTYRFSDEQIAHIEGLLQNKKCPFRDYYHLLFSLGKAREDRKEYREAMAAYVKGNQVRGRNVPWDGRAFHEECQRLRSFFSEQLFAQREGQGCQARDPIFVVGLPRAGSTLIEQILASHSQVEGTAELADMMALARKIAGKQRRDDKSQYPEALGAMDAEQLASMGQGYLDSTAVQRVTDAPYFIDKMPNNFVHVGLIHLILPNARIIDARRHPMDCCFSGFKQLFASGQGFTYGQQRIGQYYREYVELMDLWDAVLPGRVHRVQYEEMVADTEGQVRRLLDYCGLPFEEACLNFHDNTRTVRTASSEQVRQPINRSGMDRWRPFEQWLDPLKESLGPVLERYPLDS